MQSATRSRRFRRGDIVFAEGDPGDALYVVSEGKVKIFRTSPDGRENMLAVLGPGEMFGELSLFDPGPRTATVAAITDCTLASLAHDALRPWLAGRPELGSVSGVARQLHGELDRVLRLVASPLRSADSGEHPQRDDGGAHVFGRDLEGSLDAVVRPVDVTRLEQRTGVVRNHLPPRKQ